MKRLVLLFSTACLCLPVMAQSEFRYEFRRGDGAYLGVRLEDVTAEDASRLRLPAEAGALVDEVIAGSPAEEAGLLAGDVVTAVSGLPILSAAQLQRTIRENPAGRTVNLTIVRDGRTQQLSVKLGESPGLRVQPQVFDLQDFERLPRALPGLREGPGVFMWQGRPRLGIQATPLTAQMADYLNSPEQEGVLVLSVDEDSPAARAGLQAGDIIVRVGGSSVDSVGALGEQLQEGPNELEIVRNGSRQTLTAEIGETRRRSRGIRM